MVYEWKRASRIKADAQKAGELMEHLESTVGLTPKSLLDASRDDSAVLHNEFEWDDEVAAEAYRENQARHIIQCICTKVDCENGEQNTNVRAYFITSETDGYENITAIVQDASKYNSVLVMAMKELKAFQRKYSELKELSNVMAAINAVNVP